jgi:hypothetical protein
MVAYYVEEKARNGSFRPVVYYDHVPEKTAEGTPYVRRGGVIQLPADEAQKPLTELQKKYGTPEGINHDNA